MHLAISLKATDYLLTDNILAWRYIFVNKQINFLNRQILRGDNCFQRKENMPIETVDTFLEWLDEQEAIKGWSDYRLAKKANIAPSVISRARSSGILPKWDACEAIAKALNVSTILVFRKAGLLPPGPPDDVVFEDWKFLLDQLSERDRAILKQTALSMIDADEKGKKRAKREPASATN